MGMATLRQVAEDQAFGTSALFAKSLVDIHQLDPLLTLPSGQEAKRHTGRTQVRWRSIFIGDLRGATDDESQRRRSGLVLDLAFETYALSVTAVLMPTASRISWSLAIATVW